MACGKRQHSAFGEDQGSSESPNAISGRCCKTLVDYGYNYAGKDILTSEDW